MRPLIIALVYELREEYLDKGYSMEETAEFDTRASLEAMVASLERLGHQVDQIGNGQALAKRLVAGDRWDLVFPMAEGLKGRNREAQVPALLELYDQPYMLSDALTMAVALDKSVAKRLVRDAGIPTAEFMVIETGREDLDSWRHFPAFVKPVAEGSSKGCNLASKVNDSAELKQAANALLHHFRQPVLLEAFLPGREFTVGIIGNGDEARVLGVAEITMNAGADLGIFTLRNKEDQDTLCTFSKVTDVQAQKIYSLGLAAYHALGCRDICRIDFRSDSDGNPYFMEANPIAGLHPTDSDLPVLAASHGTPYDTLMGNIVKAALGRYREFDQPSQQILEGARINAAE